MSTVVLVQVRVLGPLEVVSEGRQVPLRGIQERRLLVLLAAYANEAVPEERISLVLWGADPPRTALSTIRNQVVRLRRVLDPDITISAATDAYRLIAAPGTTDIDEVQTMEAAARRACGAEDWERAEHLASDALTRFRGPVLADLSEVAGISERRAALEALRASVIELRARAQLGLGHHESVAEELAGLGDSALQMESLWACRVVALYRCGRADEALEVAEAGSVHLAASGGEPPAELARLAARIRAADPALGFAPIRPAGTLPSGVVTFLLTDIEDSTRHWEDDPVSMACALERHDALIEEIVSAEGGLLLKSKGEGDATVSVFERASDAVGAAVAFQRALASEQWPGDIVLRVRAAVHSGEAVERDGDYYGQTLNRAARVRSLAAGGQVLCSQTAVELVHDRLPPRVSIVDLGSRTLRGVARSEHLYGLSAPDLTAPPPPFDRGSAPARPAVPFPAELEFEGEIPFVGRELELDRLSELLSDAAHGSGRAVLLSGEPGVGKTRIVAEAAMAAQTSGTIVLYGRCDEGLGMSYQPFAEALGAYVAASAPEVVRSHAGSRLGELHRLLPNLGTRLQTLPTPASADAETERFLLFEAAADFLAAIGRDAPVLLVLDDLHWATKPTLLLLRHLLHRVRAMHLLLVGTYRHTDLHHDHPLLSMLADVRRETGVHRLFLEGLIEKEVGAFLTAAAGHTLDERGEDLARALHQATEGNPFFVGEVLAHLVESGVLYQEGGYWTARPDVHPDDIGLPESVREVVMRRVASLPDDTAHVLRVASIIGQSFPVWVLEAMPDVAAGGDALLDSLEEATQAGLLHETEEGFEFSHALVRQAILDELSSARRARLHRLVGEAMEARYGDTGTGLSAIARHFAQAAGPGDGPKAARYFLRAAHEAASQLAFEDAAALVEQGLACIDGSPADDRELEFELHLTAALASIQHLRTPETRAAAFRAAEIARSLGSGDRLARVAGCFVVSRDEGMVNPDAVALCEEALESLPEEDSPERVRVLTALAFQQSREGSRWSADTLTAEALGMAERIDDAEGVMLALRGRYYALVGTPQVATQLGVTERLVRMAFRSGNLTWQADAYRVRGIVRLVLGDVAGFDADATVMEQLSERVRYRFLLGLARTWQGMRAMMDGRFDDVEALARDAVYRSGGDTNFQLAYASQIFWLGRERGQVEELRPLLEAIVADKPDIVGFRAALALVLTELGEDSAAAAHLRDLARDNFAAIPRDSLWPATAAHTVEVVAALGDVDAAASLYDLWVPYSGLLVVTNPGTTCHAAADRLLGMLASLLGRFDAAEDHFARGLALEEAIGAGPLVARSRYWYAHLLRQRSGPGDAAKAGVLLGEVADAADSYGMAGLGRLVAEARAATS